MKIIQIHRYYTMALISLEIRAANLSLSKKILLSLKNHILRLKKSIFVRGARITSTKREVFRARLRALDSTRVLSGAILALFFYIIIQKL